MTVLQMLLSYYYSCLSCNAIADDIIYVIGYGLDNLRINTWLKEACDVILSLHYYLSVNGKLIDEFFRECH